MMQALGGGSSAVRLGDFRFGHESFHQRLEMRILKLGDETGQSLP